MLKKIFKNQSPLSIDLLVKILLFSSVFTLLSTSYQVFNEFNQGVNSIEKRMDLIINTSYDSLVSSVWDLSSHQTELILEGIYNQPEIHQITLVYSHGDQIDKGFECETNNCLVKTLELTRTIDNIDLELGKLTITASLDDVYRLLQDKIFVILITQMIKTLVTAFFILWIFQVKVINHLQSLSRFAQNFSLNNLNESLRLQKKNSQHNQDEFDVVADALKQMQMRLAQDEYERQKHAIKLQKLIQERTDALKKAEEATKAKSSFLATMSHEIRTPLNGVIGITDLLLHSEVTQEQRSQLEILRSSGETLLTLISDILDYSKIEAGQLELEKIPVCLADLMNEIESVFQPQFTNKGVELQIQIDPNMPGWIESDPTRLKQIFLNLLSNALKFTHSGSVTVTIKPTESPERWRVHVKDTGIGISESNRKKLFQSFQQADNSITRQYGGTGLGLSICWHLTEAMGGKIWVESEEDGGSDFIFEFVAKVVQPLETQAHEDLDKMVFENLQVLVVEDNKVNQMLAIKLLNKMDIFADVANDGLEALEMMENKKYNLVFMDMQMPRMDGVAATIEWRSNRKRYQPIIIALTANAFQEDQQACLEAGMNGFLTKPITLKSLRNAVREHVMLS